MDIDDAASGSSERLTSMTIKFRESESQAKAEQGILMQVLRNQANDYYDSFM